MRAVTPDQREQLASRLRVAIIHTFRRLRQEGEVGLPPSLSSALASVHRHGPLLPSQLAMRERVTRPTASRIIGQLVLNGLVSTTSHPIDGRSYNISITPRGLARLTDARARSRAHLFDALGNLTPEELDTLDRAAGILETLFEDDR